MIASGLISNCGDSWKLFFTPQRQKGAIPWQVVRGCEGLSCQAKKTDVGAAIAGAGGKKTGVYFYKNIYCITQNNLS